MNVVAAFGVVLVLSFLVVFLREQSASFSWLAALAGCVVILLYTAYLLYDARADIAEVFSLLSGSDAAVLLRITGIAVLSQTVQEICLDAGQRALASRVDFLGKVAILLAAAPLLASFVKILSELLG